MLLKSCDHHGFPRNKLIVTICGRNDQPVELVDLGEDREVRIYVPKNCYDLSHVYAIHHFIDHPKVSADYYIGIHDTCVITETFAAMTAQYAETMKHRNLDVLYALRTRQLGLAGFSQSFMRKYGLNYNQEIDKPQAWAAEHGGELSYSSFVSPDKVGEIDCDFMYGVGQAIYSDIIRHPIHIASLGMIKFVANDGKNVNPPWQERKRP